MKAHEYLATVTEAAKLLDTKIYPGDVKRLAQVIDKLSHGFPGDVISKSEALRRLAMNSLGDLEELELLLKVFPTWSGSVRYKLNSDTLQWQWSSKKTGRYATITVPFPTTLPLTIEVQRFCDLDDLDNHGDECPQRYDEDSDEYSSDCNCESFVEQTATVTVADWNDAIAEKVAHWLARAVDEPVKNLKLK